MTTLKNFQAEIEEVHARERGKHHVQGVRVLLPDGQRRQTTASTASEAGTTMFESDLHPYKQEERILVSRCPVIVDQYLDTTVSPGVACCSR